VYAITDGEDNYSKTYPRDVEREFLSKGIRLFFFVWSNSPFLSREEPLDQRMRESNLQHMAEATGGIVVNIGAATAVKQRNQLDATVQRLYDAMAPFYELGVQGPALQKLSPWKLEVVDTKGRKRRDIEVSYPRQLLPCAPH
jgi:hypothetical protein